jgi:hypothetical protein
MEIHIARDGEQFGPFSPEEVRRQLVAGTLLPTDFAWAQGVADWTPLSAVPGLMPAPAKIGSAPQAAPWQSSAATGPEVAREPVMRTSVLAVMSMICGVFSITLLIPGVAGIAAVVCGHLARGRVRRSKGWLLGEGMATAGLVTGYLGLFLVLLAGLFILALLLAGQALPFFGQAQMEAKRVQSMGQARDIVAACQAYARDHQGAFPKTLELLVPKYLPDRQILVCPLSGSGMAVGYVYFGGMARDPEDVLLMSKYHDASDVRVVARVNGATLFEKPPLQSLPSGRR